MFQNVTQYIYRLIPRHTVRKLQCGKGRRGLPNTPSDSGWGGGYVGSATHSERYQGRELELWYSLPSCCTPPSPPLAPVCVSRLSSLQTYISLTVPFGCLLYPLFPYPLWRVTARLNLENRGIPDYTFRPGFLSTVLLIVSTTYVRLTGNRHQKLKWLTTHKLVWFNRSIIRIDHA